MDTYKIAAIQLDSKANKGENLDKIERMIAEAALQNVKLISLPEVMNIIAEDNAPEAVESIPGYTTDRLVAMAKKYGMWIHGGSIREENNGHKPYNTTVLISSAGEMITKYRKIHLFDVEIDGGPNIKESDRIKAGSEIVTAKTELGTLGFSICYDIRFPEIYRLMALSGAQVIFTPANFTYTTGEAHWESILRCRAIENGCYIVAAAQCGEKPRFRAYGNSMIVDPWGKIIARKGDNEEGMLIADIDLNSVKSCREQIPSIHNRREDVYSLSAKGN